MSYEPGLTPTTFLWVGAVSKVAGNTGTYPQSPVGAASCRLVGLETTTTALRDPKVYGTSAYSSFGKGKPCYPYWDDNYLRKTRSRRIANITSLMYAIIPQGEIGCGHDIGRAVMASGRPTRKRAGCGC